MAAVVAEGGFLLDTNVLSELMRPSPDEHVKRWLDRWLAVDLWLSAISVAEIRLGLALLPDGERTSTLVEAGRLMLEEDFADRCLPFDNAAASEYASVVAARSRQGRPISVEDAQIAAIALSNGLTLATRNTRDFQGIERMAIVNPWSAADDR